MSSGPHPGQLQRKLKAQQEAQRQAELEMQQKKPKPGTKKPAAQKGTPPKAAKKEPELSEEQEELRLKLEKLPTSDLKEVGEIHLDGFNPDWDRAELISALVKAKIKFGG